MSDSIQYQFINKPTNKIFYDNFNKSLGVLISGSLDLFSDEYFKATVNKYDPGSGQR